MRITKILLICNKSHNKTILAFSDNKITFKVSVRGRIEWHSISGDSSVEDVLLHAVVSKPLKC